MRTNIIFRGFEGFEHLRDYVQDCLDSSLGKLNLNSVDEIKVIVDTTHGRRLGHPPQFLCETVMKTKNRNFFAKKTDASFHHSIKKCTRAIAKTYVSSTRSLRDKRRGIDRKQSVYDLHSLEATVA